MFEIKYEQIIFFDIIGFKTPLSAFMSASGYCNNSPLNLNFQLFYEVT